MDKQLSKREQELIKLAASGGKDSELVLLDRIHELEDKFDSKTQEFKDAVKELKAEFPNLDNILKSIRGNDGKDSEVPGPQGPIGPAGKDGKDGKTPVKGIDYFDGKDGRDGIDGKSVDEEKVVQKIIAQIPTPKDGTDGKDGSPDTPDEVVEKINKSSLLIDKSRIDGLIDSLSQMVSAGVAVTTNFFNGKRAKNLNIKAGSNVTVTTTNTGDQVDVTIASTGGSGGGAFTDLTDVPNSYSGQSGKFVSVKSTEDGLQFSTLSGGGDMSTSTYDPAGVSEQLVGLTATQTLTNKDLTDGSNTFPTFNQDTTGNAATATALETARTIAGQSFDGTANIDIALSDLSDVNVTEGSGIDGYSLTWDNATSKWVATNVSGGGSGITIGTTTISGGTNTRILYNNSGVAGEYSVSGSGNVAMTTSPTFTTPTLGAATATSINKVAITAPASSATLTIADGKTFTASNTVTFTGTDGVSMNVSNNKIAQITGIIDGGGSALTGGTTSICIPAVFAGTITAWTITVDTGTCTIKTWKKATGTAIPTASDSISTSGVAISTGTALRSTTLSDFTTTTVNANDLFIFDASSVSGATKISFTLEITKS